MRALSVGTFFHVEGGMDAPWRRIGERVDVRTGVDVQHVEQRGARVAVTTADGTEEFDGAVVAVPAPLACDIVDAAVRPAWLDQVHYVPHVRLYAARRAAGPPRSGIHVFPNTTVATVEIGAGRFGAWGQVPDDWEWALVCSPSTGSAPLIDLDEDDVKERLWRDAAQIDPRLFSLDDADVVQLIRWRHAVPDVRPGYHRRLATFQQRPPVVFAGDWLVQPCVEGAVRSGNAAANCFPAAGGAR
jgi:predicted NAD/FAD-dependent oxidoreductase